MAVLPFFLISGVTLIARFAPCSPWHRKFSGSKQKKLLDRRFATEWIIAILALSLGYLINGVITDVIKNAYGRPRPDFLSRCFTPKGVYLDGTSDYWLTLPTRSENNFFLSKNLKFPFGLKYARDNFSFIQIVKIICQRSAAPAVELQKSERSDRKILHQSSSSSEWLQK